MKRQIALCHGTAICAFFLFANSARCRAQGGLIPSPTTIPGSPGVQPAAAQSGVYNQPIVVNASEKVEMERLRLEQEREKTIRETAVFRETIVLLQAEIAKKAGSAILPEAISTEYRTFLSQNEGNIKRTTEYYNLLKSIVNDLTAESPYAGGTSKEKTNPARAGTTLLKLDDYADEDEGIARTLRAHVTALYQSNVNENTRRMTIERGLADCEVDRKREKWNYKILSTGTTFSPNKRATDAETDSYKEKLRNIEEREATLKAERLTLGHMVTEAKRQLQFQQYLVELVFQRRYIHALIACGFYRSSPAKGDLAMQKGAWPSDRENGQAPAGKGPAPANNNPFGVPSPGSLTPKIEIPFIATISGMEGFLTNIIRDARKDREAMDNMLKEGQINAAEALLRKMVTTAKYQPELNTLPYPSRQRILGNGEDMGELSNALTARNYPEITRLVTRLEQTGRASGMQNIKAFATEQPSKALYLAKQAELAVKLGDHKSAQSMMDAAKERAPLDPAVNAKIDEIQGSSLNNSKQSEEVKRIVEAGDYQKAYDRVSEFAPLVVLDPDKTLKDRFDKLIEKEQAIRKALEKCDVFERRSSYPDVWLTLCGVDPSLADDLRLVKRKNSIAGKCPRFIAAYTKATEYEQTGGDPIALAWYLSALTEAPGNTELVEKVNNLGARVLNN